MKHADLWQAIDRLAAMKGLSTSGLARRSGLDPTSFNKSKRQSRNGKPRWPSTESIAKILAATDTGMSDFIALLEEEDRERPSRRFALVALSACRQQGADAVPGKPNGDSPDEVIMPNVNDPDAFALKIDSEAFSPCLRKGDIVIVSPNAERRKGDRIAVGLTSGSVLLKCLTGEGAENITLQDLSAAGEERAVMRSDVAWAARILWAGL